MISHPIHGYRIYVPTIERQVTEIALDGNDTFSTIADVVITCGPDKYGQFWYLNNKLHRTDGPAVAIFLHTAGKITVEQKIYCLNGQPADIHAYWTDLLSSVPLHLPVVTHATDLRRYPLVALVYDYIFTDVVVPLYNVT
jgi:hypothetical protein